MRDKGVISMGLEQGIRITHIWIKQDPPVESQTQTKSFAHVFHFALEMLNCPMTMAMTKQRGL